MKTIYTTLFILGFFAINQAHADFFYHDPNAAKDKALIELTATSEGIHCSFQILRSKVALTGRTLLAKQYAEANFVITPSERIPNSYQMDYSEIRWVLPKKMKIKLTSMEEMGAALKQGENLKQENSHFTLDGFKLTERMGRFVFKTEKGTSLSGPSVKVNPDATPLKEYSWLNGGPGTQQEEMWLGWADRFLIDGPGFKKSGGTDPREISTAALLTNLGLSLATDGIWVVTGGIFLHDMWASIQSGSCVAGEN